MRYPWTQAAAALLIAVFLAASAVPAATAQSASGVRQGSARPSPNLPAEGSDRPVRKVLRATGQPDRWEVLVSTEKEGEWEHHAFVKEVYRHPLAPPPAIDEALKSLIDSYGTALLIGEVQSGKEKGLYLAGAVFQDAAGEALKPFVPFHVNESYQGALEFAQAYGRTFGGMATGHQTLASPALPAPEESLVKIEHCEEFCENQLGEMQRACESTEARCHSDADLFRDICLATCAPGDLTCGAACLTVAVGAHVRCDLNRITCDRVATGMWGFCMDGCNGGGGGGGGCLTAVNTETAKLPLREATGRGEKLQPAPVEFPLARAEKRGAENFIMDEWAIVQDGEVRRSSNPAFARAVADQDAEKSLGLFLVIQEPVHDMNSRHVPKPRVRVAGTRLTASERGAGELVAARLELSPTQEVDRVEILHTSEPMEESRLERLIGGRVGLEFTTEKGHRTAVYVVFRLTDRVEVLGTATAFPKCCCGGMHCV